MTDLIMHHGKPLPCPHCGKVMRRDRLISHLSNVRDDAAYCQLQCGCGGRNLNETCFASIECDLCINNYNRMAIFG